MDQAQNSPSWELFLHLSLLLGWVVPIPFIDILLPIIIWQVTRRQYPQIDPHARNVLNWLISSTLYSVILLATLVGTIFLPILWGMRFVFPIIAAIQASKGKVWQYPLTLDFLGARPEKHLKRAAIGFLSLVVIPMAMLLGSMAWQNRRTSWLASLSPATGTVTKVMEKVDDYGDTVYKPVVTFKVPQQESYHVSPADWSNALTYKKGESVDVLYSPADPADAIINEWFEKWGGVTIVLVFSAVLLGFAIIPSLFCWVISCFV
ncbi:DUF4870 domain-containing protein [Leptolyngbya cf. ectocarpi LEGE 11479]|uniref:DUF4870 domain-containing protein n=1 Tax=Leptolyngbya cf. ectocarpi LEGE 11479 TaxID=1828722 RepID=A0A929A016_LEPEC|nr:DUF4870 domain-containing protein [Leptolyngbya ectocarpi]MBE9070572.1 DUF4870 domain-containing protein [Leptolyngbya cf. ectocarpi LEGE 11479]